MRSSTGKRRGTPATTAHWTAAAGTALTAMAYLAAWLYPAVDLELTESLIYAFGLEFFIVHAGVMVPAARAGGHSRALLIAAIYLLIALAVGIGLGPWTFIGFAYLTVLEILPALQDRAEDLAVTALAGAGKAALYFVVIVTAFLLPVPLLGVTPDVDAALALDISGVTDPGPQNVLCAGFVYFAVLAGVRWRLAR
jgi:hypothetical protein